MAAPKARRRRTDHVPRAKWTIEQREAALAMYARTGSYVATERKTGVPLQTVHEWMQRPEAQALVGSLRKRARELLGQAFMETVALGVAEAHADLELARENRPVHASAILRDVSSAMRAVMPPEVAEPAPDDKPLTAPDDDVTGPT